MKKLLCSFLSVGMALVLAGCYIHIPDKKKQTSSVDSNYSQTENKEISEEDNMYNVVVKDISHKINILVSKTNSNAGVIKIAPTDDAVDPCIVNGKCAENVLVEVDEPTRTITISNNGKIDKNSIEIIIQKPVCDLRFEDCYLEIDADCTKSDNLKISSNGGVLNGTIQVNTNSCSIDLEGANEVTLCGKSQSAEITVEGASIVNAKDLISDVAKVSLSGTGFCSVYANNQLDAEVDGLGKIHYYGNPPTANKSVSGLGSITAK